MYFQEEKDEEEEKPKFDLVFRTHIYKNENQIDGFHRFWFQTNLISVHYAKV